MAHTLSRYCIVHNYNKQSISRSIESYNYIHNYTYVKIPVLNYIFYYQYGNGEPSWLVLVILLCGFRYFESQKFRYNL